MRRWLILGVGLAVTALVAIALTTLGGGQSRGTAIREACGPFGASPRYSECALNYAVAHGEATVNSESAPTDATTEAPPEKIGGSLSYVGTITGSGEGTAFSDNYRLGPLLYSKEGTPPEAVLNACNLNNPTLIARSVCARGQLTITYQEGSLPTAIGINSWEEVVQGKLYGVVAFRVNGEWQCRNEEGLTLEFQPGGSQTLPIWVIAVQVLSNAQPRVPASVLNTWYFNFVGQPLGNQGSLTIHGPGAGWCEEEFSEEERLLLYNRSGSC